jgi:hypothetical protein
MSHVSQHLKLPSSLAHRDAALFASLGKGPRSNPPRESEEEPAGRRETKFGSGFRNCFAWSWTTASVVAPSHQREEVSQAPNPSKFYRRTRRTQKPSGSRQKILEK